MYISFKSHLPKVACLTISLILILSGCASTQSAFIRNADQLSDVDFCQNYLKDVNETYGERHEASELKNQYLEALKYQYEIRGLSYSDCRQLVSEHNKKITTGIVVGVVVTAAVVAVAMAGASGGGSSSNGSSGYAWDQFYNQYNVLTWNCRSKANGQFSDNYNCSGLARIDNTWPGK